MRSGSVVSGRSAFAVRAILSLILASLFISILGVPEAEARRRNKRAHVTRGYTPPLASMVFDMNSGRTLEATNANAPRHPASITKVMTLYMLFEQLETGRFKLSSELPVSRQASIQAPSKLGLRPGETITVEDAIKALVTKSANDVAVVIGEAIGGDEERFAQMMTRKARALGMSRSIFFNASGLPHPRQFTTARDLVTLGKAIQERFPKYYAFFGTRSFSYAGSVHRNHNRLLGQIEGVDGIKTGYTNASGFNLLTSAKINGRHIITVVLGGRSARQRDQQVASLIENNMGRAHAGRQRTARTVEVAVNEERDTERDMEDGASADLPLARPVARPAAPTGRPQVSPAADLPQPPNRPRTAVIADAASAPVEGWNPGLTRSRPLALTASGSTGVVAAASSPVAMLSATPRTPTLRWVEGPQAVEARSANRRIPPPNDVRYTNAIPSQEAMAEEGQPLPAVAPSGKVEERLPSPQARAEASAAASALAGEDWRAKEDTESAAPSASPTGIALAGEAAPAAASSPAPRPTARSGWMIQLAAAASDAKAQEILASAKARSGAVLAQAEPYTESVTRGRTQLWRARFSGFDESGAQEACKAVKRAGFGCFAQKL